MFFNIDQYFLSKENNQITCGWKTEQGPKSQILPLTRLIDQYLNHVNQIQHLFQLFQKGTSAFLSDDVGFKVSLYFEGRLIETKEPATRNDLLAILTAYNIIFGQTITPEEVF